MLNVACREVRSPREHKQKVINSRQRKTEGFMFYDYEFAGQGLHEIRTLCVYKSKLWRLSAVWPEKAWPKRDMQTGPLQRALCPSHRDRLLDKTQILSSAEIDKSPRVFVSVKLNSARNHSKAAA